MTTQWFDSLLRNESEEVICKGFFSMITLSFHEIFFIHLIKFLILFQKDILYIHIL